MGRCVRKRSNCNDDALNGKNHTASDWRDALAVVDLNDPAFVVIALHLVMHFWSYEDGYKPAQLGIVMMTIMMVIITLRVKEELTTFSFALSVTLKKHSWYGSRE